MTKNRNILSPRRFWTEVELELLRSNYADSLTSDLAIALGRTEKQVLAKAHAMNLHKSRQFIAELARERALAPDHGGIPTRFKKGIVPANKGIRRPGWAPGDMAKTQFKKGSKPYTWRPIGSYRVTADGVLERKVNDLPGNSNVRWKGVHVLVWAEVNGPVPAGHVVVFKPGHHTTDLAKITLDVVELLSRAQLMARNTIHNLHPKIVEVSRLRGTLKRAINRRSKKENPVP